MGPGNVKQQKGQRLYEVAIVKPNVLHDGKRTGNWKMVMRKMGEVQQLWCPWERLMLWPNK